LIAILSVMSDAINVCGRREDRRAVTVECEQLRDEVARLVVVVVPFGPAEQLGRPSGR